jgi:hypothetical protein
MRNYARTCFFYGKSQPDFSRVDFSELCTFLEYVELREYGGGECWSESGCRELLAFKYYLAKTLVESTPVGNALPAIYKEFASQLREWDVVITFNWDCLLEAALRAVGKPYSYTFDENSVKILKLHGSTNWRLPLIDAENSRLKWKSLAGIVSNQIYWCSELDEFRTWQKQEPLAEVEPLLVLPGMGKSREVRRLASLWYKPESIFAFTGDVYVIGLSLTKDDFFIRSFFIDSLPFLSDYAVGRRLVIINRDPRVRLNYEFVLDKRYAVFVSEPFSMRHVRAMGRPAREAFC